jgi:hypothetical protein
VKLRIAFITLSLCMLGLGLLLQYEMRFMAPTTFTDAARASLEIEAQRQAAGWHLRLD